MYENVNRKMEQLPPDYPEDLLASIREEFKQSGKTIVVLDDDPTGTQTCRDVTVLTSWQASLIAGELKKKTVYSVYPDQFKKSAGAGSSYAHSGNRR
jgi:hypothetical protein